MEAELTKASHWNGQVGGPFHRCDMMLSKYSEQVSLLSDRWRRIQGQIDTRYVFLSLSLSLISILYQGPMFDLIFPTIDYYAKPEDLQYLCVKPFTQDTGMGQGSGSVSLRRLLCGQPVITLTMSNLFAVRLSLHVWI